MPVESLPQVRLTLTVPEAARLLGISRNLAYRLVQQGELPSLRFGRNVRIPRAELEEHLRRRSQSTD